MKKILLILAISSSAFAGGDLGGGGLIAPLAPIKKSFDLSPQEIELLQHQETLESAYAVWLQKIDQKRQEKLFRDVFETHIIPQIDPSQAK